MIELNDGRSLRHHAKAVRGTPDNPMTAQEIEDKARDLLDPVIGAEAGRGGLRSGGATRRWRLGACACCFAPRLTAYRRR